MFYYQDKKERLGSASRPKVRKLYEIHINFVKN